MTVTPVLHVGARRVPVVLPRLSDARLHTAAVVMTIHVLGQVALDFAVSVPQIAVAILAAAVLEIAIAFRRTAALVWPASAMLTGSGVGLIMRAVGTEPGDHWAWHRWYLFAIVAGGSLLTKYAIRWRDAHVFNPSNVGLVAAFLLLGSDVVEPLPFRWAGIGPAMVVAYAVIVVGGVLITRRLALLEMAVACWVALVAGVGVQSAAGHCVNVPWSDIASCDIGWWRVIATSPEVLVFLFFMLTDPRTVPAGRAGRAAFAVAVGGLAAVLIAPQHTEFGAKVALLGALTIVTAARPVLVAARQRVVCVTAGARPEAAGIVMGACVPLLLAAWAGAIVTAGSGARTAGLTPIAAAALPPLDAIEWVEPPEVPMATVDERALAVEPTLAGEAARRIVMVGLLRALAGEAQALRDRDVELLSAVDHGRRLTDLRDAIESAIGEPLAVTEYVVESARLTMVHPRGQGGALLAVDATGIATITWRDERGIVVETAVPETFRHVFALRTASDGRLLIADVQPPSP